MGTIQNVDNGIFCPPSLMLDLFNAIFQRNEKWEVCDLYEARMFFFQSRQFGIPIETDGIPEKVGQKSAYKCFLPV